MNMHKVHDRKSLEIHRLISLKIRENPALIDIVLTNLEKLKKEHPHSRANEEWDLILMGTLDFICKYICDEGENATKLRQSSPFIGILTQQERKEVYENLHLNV